MFLLTFNRPYLVLYSPKVWLAEPHAVFKLYTGGKTCRVFSAALPEYYLLPVYQYCGDVRSYRAGKLLENDSSLAHCQPTVQSRSDNS